MVKLGLLVASCFTSLITCTPAALSVRGLPVAVRRTGTVSVAGAWSVKRTPFAAVTALTPETAFLAVAVSGFWPVAIRRAGPVAVRRPGAVKRAALAAVTAFAPKTAFLAVTVSGFPVTVRRSRSIAKIASGRPVAVLATGAAVAIAGLVTIRRTRTVAVARAWSVAVGRTRPVGKIVSWPVAVRRTRPVSAWTVAIRRSRAVAVAGAGPVTICWPGAVEAAFAPGARAVCWGLELAAGLVDSVLEAAGLVALALKLFSHVNSVSIRAFKLFKAEDGGRLTLLRFR